AAAWPSLKAITFGIERMSNALESAFSSSELTFASLTRPAYSAATFSSTGVSALHGPHHGAQKSTTTGMALEPSMTSSSNVAVVTSIVYSMGARAAEYKRLFVNPPGKRETSSPRAFSGDPGFRIVIPAAAGRGGR